MTEYNQIFIEKKEEWAPIGRFYWNMKIKKRDEIYPSLEGRPTFICTSCATSALSHPENEG
jgi:hypothetical protein